MMLLACSHLVIATENVKKMTHAFATLFELKPHFENPAFSEFVLESRFRIAFFKPTGPSANYFTASASRENVSFGLTVTDVDSVYARVVEQTETLGWKVSGPPKEHPWGEKSFLLIDPDGNRWEITKTPSADGMLINR